MYHRTQGLVEVILLFYGYSSNILPWEILWREEPGGPQSMGSQKSRAQLYFHREVGDSVRRKLTWIPDLSSSALGEQNTQGADDAGGFLVTEEEMMSCLTWCLLSQGVSSCGQFLRP